MADQRNELRFPVHWRIALFPNPAVKQYYLGETYELSPIGAGIYCSSSVPGDSSVLVHLEIPPLTRGVRGDELEISAKVVHLSLHSQHGFRIGLLFQQFQGNGKALLSETLAQRFKSK